MCVLPFCSLFSVFFSFSLFVSCSLPLCLMTFFSAKFISLSPSLPCIYDRFLLYGCVCLIAQSCLTLCDPMDCSPPGSSVHGDSPGKNTGVGCHALLQGIFLTQGLNPGLLHYRQILCHLSHQGSFLL